MNEESRFSFSSIVVAANRCINVAAYAYVLNTISRGYAQIEENSGPMPAGIYKYFTVWTVMISLAFYFVCQLCEIFNYLKFDTDHFSFRGLVYHSLVFPLGFTVSVLFWIMFRVDHLQVFLPESNQLFTEWKVDHIIHTLPLIGLLIEGAFYFHPLPPRKVGLRLLFVVALSYIGVVTYLGLTQNFWVYTFLQEPPVSVKFLILLAILFCGSFVYLVGEKFHKIVWRNKLKEE